MYGACQGKWSYCVFAESLTPDQLAVPADKFEEFYGEGWAKVLEEGRASNAMDACTKLEITQEELEVAWRAAEGLKKMIKFGGGFYCALLELEGKQPFEL